MWDFRHVSRLPTGSIRQRGQPKRFPAASVCSAQNISKRNPVFHYLIHFSFTSRDERRVSADQHHAGDPDGQRHRRRRSRAVQPEESDVRSGASAADGLCQSGRGLDAACTDDAATCYGTAISTTTTMKQTNG